MPFRVLSHTADTGVEATASTFPELVAELARGMFFLMAALDPCPDDHSLEVVIAPAPEQDMVFDALSELLYRAEVEDLILCDFDISELPDGALRITATGVSARSVELTGPPIKAVTYHDLTVDRTEVGWEGRVIFDV